MKRLCMRIVLGIGMSAVCCACTTQATVSGYEDTTVVVEDASGQVRYDGCFWIDRLWEGDWMEKKSRRHTLKLARARLAPWQPVAAVATLGWWVPVYLEWELNGDQK